MNRIQRIYDILNLFTTDSPQLSVLDVANKLNLNRGTVNTLMSNMREKNILAKSEDTKKYMLGVKVYEWGQTFMATVDLKTISLPHMQKLSNDVKEKIDIHIKVNCNRDVLAAVESPEPVRVVIDPMWRKGELYVGAAGKLILSYLPQDELQDYLQKTTLKKFTNKTITNKGILKKELLKINDRGFSISIGESNDSLWSVAAPIRNYENKVIAALAIISLINRYSEEKAKEYSIKVKETANKISQDLGCKL